MKDESLFKGAANMTEFSYGERLLGHFDGREQERVAALASALDPATFSVLESIGVAPGWRCLDAGAGAGSVAQWLAGRVAPATVVAVDRDIRFLGDAAEPNLVVRELDLVTGEIPAASFDLVFARIVLLHLRGRDAVLERLRRALAPGGYLVIGETVGDLGLASSYAEIRQCMRALIEVQSAILGTDFTWVRTLPRRLAGLGLADVGIRADSPALTGGGNLARSFLMTMDALSDTAMERGLIDKDTMTRAAALLTDPGFADLAMTVIHTWGRQP